MFSRPLHVCQQSASLTIHRYLTEIGKVDIYWTGSRLNQLPEKLPCVGKRITRQAIVPFRYHFNTGLPPRSPKLIAVTFSYTAVWWDWEEWEHLLDWLALRGCNLPLAWYIHPKIGIHHMNMYSNILKGLVTNRCCQKFLHQSVLRKLKLHLFSLDLLLKHGA